MNLPQRNPLGLLFFFYLSQVRQVKIKLIRKFLKILKNSPILIKNYYIASGCHLGLSHLARLTHYNFAEDY
jgi:hypothetical protein